MNTTTRQVCARVLFPQYNAIISGIVEEMDLNAVSLNVKETSADLSCFPMETKGELVLILKGVVHKIIVEFISFTQGILNLSLCEASCDWQMRRVPRIPTEIKSPWRVWHGDRVFGAWQDGVTRDISLGGMRLIIPKPIEAPRRLEALLMLSEEWFVQNRTTRNYSDSGFQIVNAALDRQPLRVSGAVRHVAPYGEDWVTLGIYFTRVLEPDKLRLAHFLEEKEKEAQRRKCA